MSHKSDLETNRSENVVASATSSGKSTDALLMIAVGVLALLGGAVLTLGPRLSWKLAQISGGFKYLGVEGGTLAMGGMLLAALGLIRRAIANSKSADDANAMVDQLASEVVQMHSTLDEVEKSAEAMREELQELKSAIESLTEAQRSTPVVAQAPSNDDAMFRIAASLDQLGARVEQRLKAQHESMQESLEDLNEVVDAVRKNMDEVFAGVAEQNAAAVETGAPTVDASAQSAAPNASDDSEPYQAPLGLLDELDDPAPNAPGNVDASRRNGQR